MKNRLKELRVSRNLTLEGLAKLVGSSNQQISQLETGRRRLNVDWLERLGKALECHPLEILNDGVIARDEEEKSLMHVFRSMTQDQRNAFLAAAISLTMPLQSQCDVTKP